MTESNRVKPLSNIELSSFCGQMALILKSGISSMEGISIMTEDSTSAQEQQLLQVIGDTLCATGSLYLALQESGVFPDYALHMTNIGEQSGKLDEVMQSLSVHYDREAGIAAAIKNSVTYPFVMVTMMMVVILILIMKVLPIFDQVFRQLGRSMTGFSGGVLSFSALLNRYSIVFIVLLLLFIGLFLFCSYTAVGRTAFLRIAGQLGFGRRLRGKITACRFASGMALTLSSGLNSDQSLELAGMLNKDRDFQDRIAKCQALIKSGTEFSAALSESNIFTGIYARMVTVGYKTGSLDGVMQTIATRYEEEVDDQINRVIAVLEPTLVAVLSIIVGIILLSVMLPLMGIMSGF